MKKLEIHILKQVHRPIYSCVSSFTDLLICARQGVGINIVKKDRAEILRELVVWIGLDEWSNKNVLFSTKSYFSKCGSSSFN